MVVAGVEELLLMGGTAIAAAYGAKNTADIFKNDGSVSSSKQKTSGELSATGGIPDPDDEDKFTNHAKQRQDERNVSNEEIKDALKSGNKYYDPKNDSINYINKTNEGKYVQVAVDPKSGNIKTTIKSSQISKLLRPRMEKID